MVPFLTALSGRQAPQKAPREETGAFGPSRRGPDSPPSVPQFSPWVWSGPPAPGADSV